MVRSKSISYSNPLVGRKCQENDNIAEHTLEREGTPEGEGTSRNLDRAALTTGLTYEFGKRRLVSKTRGGRKKKKKSFSVPEIAKRSFLKNRKTGFNQRSGQVRGDILDEDTAG